MVNPNFMNGVPEFLILRLLSRQEMYGYELVQGICLAKSGNDHFARQKAWSIRCCTRWKNGARLNPAEKRSMAVLASITLLRTRARNIWPVWPRNGTALPAHCNC